MNTFQLPTRLFHGPDALDQVKILHGRRVMVITDPVIGTGDTAAHIFDLLENVETTVFRCVHPDPTTSLVAQAVGQMLHFEPHVVIALGGGSVIDTAKAMITVAAQRGLESPTELWTIPTTSGSGSEATSFAVITDQDTHTKIPIVSDDMVPAVAILDARAVTSVPARVTADTGMDVITHAVEAYTSTQHNDFSDALAEKAVQLAFDWLEQCYTHGDDLQARQRMHHASYLAGAAFENSGLGITHSLAHAIGGKFPLAHGRLNALLLPHVITYNTQRDPQTRARISWLGHLTGTPSSTDGMGARTFINAVTQLRRKLGIGPTLEAEGIDLVAFREAIPVMAKAALADTCTATNPVTPSVQDLQALLATLAR